MRCHEPSYKYIVYYDGRLIAVVVCEAWLKSVADAWTSKVVDDSLGVGCK